MNEFTYKPRFWLVVHLSCQTATPFWLHWNDLPHPLEWEGRLQVRRSTWWTFCQPQVSQSANHAVLGAASLAEGSYNSLIDMRLGKAFLFFLSHWSNPTDPLRPVKESHDVRWKKALNAVFFFLLPFSSDSPRHSVPVACGSSHRLLLSISCIPCISDFVTHRGKLINCGNQ